MRSITIVALAAALLAVPLVSVATADNATHGVDVSQLDRSVKPDVDFYRFANGKWLDNTQIPPDKPAIDGFTEIAIRIESTLKQIVARVAAKPAPSGSIERKIGDFYRVGMDEALADKLGARPLQPLFDEIEACRDEASLVREIARLQRLSIDAGFSIDVSNDFKNSRLDIFELSQGGLGLPDRDYYTKDDAHSKELRAQYVEHVDKMMEIAGSTTPEAEKQSKEIMALETRLAQASLTEVQQRDPSAVYHKGTKADLLKLAPGIPWDDYFKTLGLPNPGGMNIATPNFFKALDGTLSQVPIDQWKAYLRWHVVAKYAGTLSAPFVQENFRFTSALIGQKELAPRWRRVQSALNGAMGEALGKLFVAEDFPPSAKQRALALILTIKASLRDRIDALDWMGPATKVEALKKLDTLVIKVGYPDKWRDYSKLVVKTDSYCANAMRADEFEFNRDLKKAGNPVDRSEWGIDPQEVNAYYNPTNNEIVFPAAVLSPPFFDAEADDASNYGAIGMMMGHEMTHGFDDQGRQFDSQGNLRDWWTPEDAKRFAERTTALVKQYGAYPVIDDIKENGELTLGENIADLGGIVISYHAFEKTFDGKPKPAPIDGFTPEQRFFLAFAQIWRFKSSPQYIRLLAQVDPHSLPKWRVLGVLVNVPMFVPAFGPGVPGSIARPGSGSVRIW